MDRSSQKTHAARSPRARREEDLVPHFEEWGRRAPQAQHPALDLRRIVVGIDGSEGSRVALEWARVIAAEAGSAIEVVTVVPPPPYSYGDLLSSHALAGDRTTGWRGALEAERREAERILEAALDGLANGPELRRHLGVGSPGSYLARVARETDAGLIIVGSHGHDGFERALLGSVADATKQLSPTSVLIARSPPSQAPTLLTTDGSLASRDAVAAGLRIADALGSPPVVFHALESPAYGSPEDPDAFTNAARAVFDDALRVTSRGPDAPAARFEVGFGPAARAILHRAEDLQAGLVVVGTKGLGGLRGLAVGSVSNRVSHLAPCSVLLVKRMTA